MSLAAAVSRLIRAEEELRPSNQDAAVLSNTVPDLQHVVLLTS